MCFYEQLDAVKWFSATDVSEPLFGLRCVRVEGQAPQENWSGYSKLFKLLTKLPILE